MENLFFIDESGSIPKQLDKSFQHRYFVIGFMHTSDPKRVKNIYKRAISKLRTKYPEFFRNINNPKECKASEMLPFMKAYILEKLINLTDIKIAHMVVDNTEIEQRFRDIPGRSFNYLIKIIIENFNLTSADKQNLQLKIDNRNVALDGLRELEGYLFNNLVLESGIVHAVDVEYLESCDHYNIQVADLIAHVVYQRFRYKTMTFPNYGDISQYSNLSHPYTFEYLYQQIKPRTPVAFVFPVRNRSINDAAASISL